MPIKINWYHKEINKPYEEFAAFMEKIMGSIVKLR
jgi:hypothetical protein